MTCRHCSRSATSRMTVLTSTPASRAASRTTFALAAERTEPTESKPRRASSTAVARPIPELAPVVRTGPLVMALVWEKPRQVVVDLGVDAQPAVAAADLD